MVHGRHPDHGIYLHMPWCASRCPYCAFFKVVNDAPPYARWGELVLRDWRYWAPQFSGRTHSIYFGGGTPSLAPSEVIGSVLARLPSDPDTEVTLEANPGTLDQKGLEAFKDQGVNRISLGIQSLQPAQARFLSRGHTAQQARALLKVVPQMGFRSWSADLIFALPGQSLEMLDRDIDALLEAEAPHISLYGLTIEPGTAFAKLRAEGRLSLPDSDHWADLYSHIQERLEAAGMEQYEISNFARPGHRSVHNGQVWRGGFYAGLGPSAHGFTPSGIRTFNPADLDTWMRDPPNGGEIPSPGEAAIDYLLSTLRHVEGSDLDELARRTGMQPEPARIQMLIQGGMLYQNATHLCLTRAGQPLADGVVEKLIERLISIQPKADTDTGI